MLVVIFTLPQSAARAKLPSNFHGYSLGRGFSRRGRLPRLFAAIAPDLRDVSGSASMRRPQAHWERAKGSQWRSPQRPQMTKQPRIQMPANALALMPPAEPWVVAAQAAAA